MVMTIIVSFGENPAVIWQDFLSFCKKKFQMRAHQKIRQITGGSLKWLPNFGKGTAYPTKYCMQLSEMR